MRVCLLGKGYILGKHGTETALSSSRERSSLEDECGWEKMRENIIFSYLHVFRIIQNGGKYYIIVNNLSIINHEGLRQRTYGGAAHIQQQKITSSTQNEKKKEKRRTRHKKASRAREGIIHLSFAVCFWLCVSHDVCLLNISENSPFFQWIIWMPKQTFKESNISPMSGTICEWFRVMISEFFEFEVKSFYDDLLSWLWSLSQAKAFKLWHHQRTASCLRKHLTWEKFNLPSCLCLWLTKLQPATCFF